MKVPDIYYFPFDKAGLEKPWEENREKVDDYFNYGRCLPRDFTVAESTLVKPISEIKLNSSLKIKPPTTSVLHKGLPSASGWDSFKIVPRL